MIRCELQFLPSTCPNKMPPFSKSVRDHALGSLCFKNLTFDSVFKIHEDPRARFLTYTKKLLLTFLTMKSVKIWYLNMQPNICVMT